MTFLYNQFGEVTGHILFTPRERTPPWATHERLTNVAPDRMLLTDCCCCRMRADETTVTIEHAPHIPIGLNERERHEWITGNATYYYDPEYIIECGDGLGCKANPRRKIGKAAREFWQEVYAA